MSHDGQWTTLDNSAVDYVEKENIKNLFARNYQLGIKNQLTPTKNLLQNKFDDDFKVPISISVKVPVYNLLFQVPIPCIYQCTGIYDA